MLNTHYQVIPQKKNQFGRELFRRSFICSAILMVLNSHVVGAAEHVEFDPAFLSMVPGSDVDLNRFSNGSSALPGKYRADIYLNQSLVGVDEVDVRTPKSGDSNICLTKKLLGMLNLNMDKLSSSSQRILLQDSQECYQLSDVIPGSGMAFDSNEQRLDVTIPHIFINHTAQGSVNPALWDSGIAALMLGYDMNVYEQRSGGYNDTSYYGGVSAGMNIGAWYLRHNGNYSASSHGEKKKYTTLNTYLQRDIPFLRGRLLMGQSNTTGQLFDTVPFTGVQIASDERMLPQSRRGYAPEIHGVARTNARVTVRQNNQVIYETTVAPGEFLINDLYPSGYGGDLNVTVKEADGSEQKFSVPFSSMTQLLRPGVWKYSMTAGRVRGDYLHDAPILTEGSLRYGINNTLTGYTGMQLTSNYFAAQAGLGVDTPVGALAFDVTKSRARVTPNPTEGHMSRSQTGESYRLSFSKIISETDSNISLAAYRFSTSGYLDLMPALQMRDANKMGDSTYAVERPKNRLTLTASQGLGDGFGQFYVTGSLQNYWGKRGDDKQYQVGYNNHWGQVSYNLSASKTWNNTGRAQNSYTLSFSVPLGGSEMRNAPQLRMDLTHDSSGRTNEMTSLNGTLGENSPFSYGISAAHANQNVGTSGSANAQYRSRAATFNGSWSGGKNYNSVSAGMSGMALLHSGGLTLSPYSFDTVALVEAKGAEGAQVSGYPGVSVDSRGYAIVPYLNPYEMNEIGVDPRGTSQGVELDSTSQRVAPYAGAVVKLSYNTRTGYALLINANRQGKPLPFGASVTDDKGNYVGNVGQGGQLFARVAQDSGALFVQWGEANDQRCRIDYRLPKGADTNTMQTLNSICLPAS